MELIHEPNRIYGLDEHGTLLAEITFPEDGPSIVNIDHTFVSPALRGQGVADQLVRTAAQQLRSEGKRARLTCSYAVQWFSRHPEFSEVLDSQR